MAYRIEPDSMDDLMTEPELAGVARAMVGPNANLTAPERQLIDKTVREPDSRILERLRSEILTGGDPLGDAFCKVRSPEARRGAGATYTPSAIVDNMTEWAARKHVQPARVVDPGAGSGRFLAAAATKFPLSELVGVEIDPMAALLLRANAAVLGFAHRLEVELRDYRRLRLPSIQGTTLFIGNPPYVRHHDIPERWKAWFSDAADAMGAKASKLAGLHVHFFVKTLGLAKRGDYGTFITSAEWLDVNYGAVLRRLLADGLGGTELHVLDPSVMPFADAATTGAITCFAVGRRRKTIRMRAVHSLDELNGLGGGRAVPWSTVNASNRWTPIVRDLPKPPPGFMELGELFRVHRGQVTGANGVWVAGERAERLPKQYLLPTVTKARELLDAGEALRDDTLLRRVIDLPPDLDEIAPEYRDAVFQFLNWAKANRAHESYIARHRRPWWAVRLRHPAPILCTYMARRPPAFVRNNCGARHINISHGLYPLEPVPEHRIRALVAWLRENVGVEGGRCYAGGLVKFEPRELERTAIPSLENLA